jgi:hypothetical protein
VSEAFLLRPRGPSRRHEVPLGKQTRLRMIINFYVKVYGQFYGFVEVIIMSPWNHEHIYEKFALFFHFQKHDNLNNYPHFYRKGFFYFYNKGISNK